MAPALAALTVAGLLSLGLHILAMLRARSRIDSETNLPNLAALAALSSAAQCTVVVARIERFAAIAAGLGPAATVNLIHRITDRLGFRQETPIYRLDEAHLRQEVSKARREDRLAST